MLGSSVCMRPNRCKQGGDVRSGERHFGQPAAAMPKGPSCSTSTHIGFSCAHMDNALTAATQNVVKYFDNDVCIHANNGALTTVLELLGALMCGLCMRRGRPVFQSRFFFGRQSIV